MCSQAARARPEAAGNHEEGKREREAKSAEERERSGDERAAGDPLARHAGRIAATAELGRPFLIDGNDSRDDAEREQQAGPDETTVGES